MVNYHKGCKFWKGKAKDCPYKCCYHHPGYLTALETKVKHN